MKNVKSLIIKSEFHCVFFEGGEWGTCITEIYPVFSHHLIQSSFHQMMM